MARFEPDQLTFSFLLVALFAVIFRLLNYLVRTYVINKDVVAGLSIGMGERRRWRIGNELISLIHGAITGFWAFGSFLIFPQMLSDMHRWYHPAIYCLVLVSLGYLVQDTFDLSCHETSIRVLELLFHHACVISVFLCAIFTGRFVGLVACGLLMEINSVFLHTRSLLNLHAVDKFTLMYRTISIVNIVTFLIFRMASTIYLLIWSLMYRIDLGPFYFGVMFFVMLSLLIVNVVLFYRVVSVDGYFDTLKIHRRNASTTMFLFVDVDEKSNNLNSTPVLPIQTYRHLKTVES